MPPPAAIAVAETTRVADLLAAGALSAQFQPIVEIAGGAIVGYEGLVRGPRGSAVEMPAALFAQAGREGCSLELELAAAATCVEAFAKSGADGQLFVNFSAHAIVQLARQRARVLGALPAGRIVVELTEQHPASDLLGLPSALAELRGSGVSFALDDYGTANANMSSWVRLRPDIVKIDRFFIDGIASDPRKFEAVKAMQQFAAATGGRLIAEGIECAADLIVVRDLGIDCGQGFFLGRPAPVPAPRAAAAAHDALLAQHIAVFPGLPRTSTLTRPNATMAEKMRVPAPALPSHATNNQVLELFQRRPDLHAVAVVEGERPIALINRRGFMDRYARPYHREVFGKRPCLQLANNAPLIVDNATTAEQLTSLLASHDQRYLTEGFIITDHGRYTGLGTGESLVRAVTEVRVEAARYANPLTFLPGNIPISSHIARLVGKDAAFHACYVDLNQFKPFNDQYGYWQGDEVLKFAASVLADACDPTRDFLGHVGGDDFLVLFQSEDWEARAQRAIGRFDEGAQRFYAHADRLAGGIRGEDRRGNPALFGFVTMAIGCVSVPGTRRYRSDEIASVAALAKRRAKQRPGHLYLIDVEEGRAWLRAHGEQPHLPDGGGAARQP
ncbi:EAL domain-containing protein [Burkholderia glumae]|uniref:EAL domain-containing protein n=1 Tax=Burkholderia glumae TaxID=337 RepID=UPI00146397AE|nr:phosphodiesterase [Burkholderia glumae]QJP72938.1 phosphodiesterase [Burkholderia glumae]